MKVTAILPDDLVDSVRKIANGSNITESLISALREWVSHRRLSQLSANIKRKPVRFAGEDIANKLRALNRRS
jgi:hypothetical protein